MHIVRVSSYNSEGDLYAVVGKLISSIKVGPISRVTSHTKCSYCIGRVTCRYIVEDKLVALRADRPIGSRISLDFYQLPSSVFICWKSSDEDKRTRPTNIE